MLAPEKFVQWLSAYTHTDRRYGHVYRYHPRSNAHSIALCTFVLQDLIDTCPALRNQAERGEIVYGIDERFLWASTGKRKTLDLALGPPATTEPPARDMKTRGMPGNLPPLDRTIRKGKLADVLLSCEAKSVMTEHGKSKPRVYDELSSSHEIVHQGRQDAIAAGITIVNIAETFISPLRQNTSSKLNISRHKQPAAAVGMIEHLRGLPLRDAVGSVGFDASGIQPKSRASPRWSAWSFPVAVVATFIGSAPFWMPEIA